MPTIPYSRSGMDPFRQSRRKRKQARAETQRRCRRKHRKENSERNKELYAAKKAERERLVVIAEREVREWREKDAALWALMNTQAPSLSVRDVLARPFL